MGKNTKNWASFARIIFQSQVHGYQFLFPSFWILLSLCPMMKQFKKSHIGTFLQGWFCIYPRFGSSSPWVTGHTGPGSATSAQDARGRLRSEVFRLRGGRQRRPRVVGAVRGAVRCGQDQVWEVVFKSDLPCRCPAKLGLMMWMLKADYRSIAQLEDFVGSLPWSAFHLFSEFAFPTITRCFSRKTEGTQPL